MDRCRLKSSTNQDHLSAIGKVGLTDGLLRYQRSQEKLGATLIRRPRHQRDSVQRARNVVEEMDFRGTQGGGQRDRYGQPVQPLLDLVNMQIDEH